MKFFLYQAVDSALRALENISGEIIVVDNNSTDGSVEMVYKEFPSVRVIANTENTGFATANNQGIKAAKGKYCLLLNPDTIVQENTFTKCVHYLENNKTVHGLGIKMIDGSGKFLPESKRSFPSPKVAFYKLFGFARIFPKSKKFGQYHLSYLDKNQNHIVDVLSGAFLMAPTKRLLEINGLDETFFMYGEDIDLSWRLKEGGFQNVYFSDSKIIHYKGESTKKGSLNYVKRFYEAMIIFAKKHFRGNKAKIFIYLMQLAVYFRAILTLTQSIIRKFLPRIIELLAGYGLLVLIQKIWGNIVEINYPETLLMVNLPIYLITTLIAMHFSGANDKPYQTSKLLRGMVLSIILCSIAYAFLPEQIRFSRALVVFSVIGITLLLLLIRIVLQYRATKKISFYGSRKRRAILIGAESSSYLVNETIFTPPFISYLGLVTNKQTNNSIGTLEKLKDILITLKPTDLLFDTEALSYATIVNTFELANKYKIKCHTILKNGEIIISSHSKNDSGQAFDFTKNYTILLPEEKRKKRLLDVFSSLVFLTLSPILIFFQKKPSAFISNCFQVLFGQKTFVGYNNEKLPKIKASVLQVGVQKKYSNEQIRFLQEENYAKFYSVYEDIDLLLKNLYNLGNKPVHSQ